MMRLPISAGGLGVVTIPITPILSPFSALTVVLVHDREGGRTASRSSVHGMLLLMHHQAFSSRRVTGTTFKDDPDQIICGIVASPAIRTVHVTAIHFITSIRTVHVTDTAVHFIALIRTVHVTDTAVDFIALIRTVHVTDTAVDFIHCS